jgi:aspartyl-tRNA(Asn)/glutamyl-tRNA(Gln) amidotransferase subunit B
MQWETVIGLEIHAQLATQTKIFSGASTAFGAEPNTQACAVDLALPGTLPVLNAEAVRLAVIFGLATGCVVNRRSIFARKNYFYPDLPKGYQISQMDLPIVARGEITVEIDDGHGASVSKVVGITRAHLEEDAGKSLHEDFHNMTGIDLNRAGTPLLEIVSEPDMRSAKEAVAYAKTIHSLVRHLGIGDGNMQEGSFRVDANVSVRPKGQHAFGTRAEVKNVNSFRFLERAINFEVERQIDVIEGGGKVVQETRLYDPDRDETRSMRSKEEAHDYRYFPDPDLLPVVLDEHFIEAVRATLPELPQEKKQRFVIHYGLSAYDASFLSADRQLADYFEHALKIAACEAKLAANWVMGDISAALNKAGLEISSCPIHADMLGGLLKRIADNTLSGKLAKEVFEAMWAGEGGTSEDAADAIIEKKGLKQITDESAIEAIVDAALAQFPEQVAEFRSGKDKVFGFLVGQVMKAAKGKANPAQLNTVLKKRLEG